LEAVGKNAAHRNRVTKIAERVCRETGADPAIFTLLVGDRKTVGQKWRMIRNSVGVGYRLDQYGI
jgi:hypothetical protein